MPDARQKVRLDSDGELDEYFGTGHLHLERMDDNQWWIGLTLENGKMVMFNFGALNRSAHTYMTVDEDWEGGKFYRAGNPRGVLNA